jgi:hypothetical protein
MQQCDQGHRRRGSVLSVQVVRTMHRAVLLIIRRSWVRAHPAHFLHGVESRANPPDSYCRHSRIFVAESVCHPGDSFTRAPMLVHILLVPTVRTLVEGGGGC